MRTRLRTILVCVVLEWCAISGAPMRPEEIVDLMHAMNTPRVVQTDPDEHDASDLEPPDLDR